MSKKLLLTLIFSLALNVFLVGIFIGGHLKNGFHGGPHGSDGPPPPPEMMMYRIIEDGQSRISPAGQKIIADILDKERPEPPDMVFGKTMDDMKAVLTAEKLDVTKMDSLQKDIDKLENQHHKGIGKMIGTIARSLSDQDRAAFFKELFSGKPPHPENFRKDSPPSPDNHKGE